MSIRPEFISSQSVKPLINVGALLDIPTGSFVKGKYGESILNGGLGSLTAVVGIGNNFKSTLLHYMMLSAAERIQTARETSLLTYDTEINIHENHLIAFLRRFPLLSSLNVTATGQWTITDKTVYQANEWFEILKNFLKTKKENANKISFESPFLERDGITLIPLIVPTFTEVDSLSAFETADVAEIRDKNELGDAGGNTMYMRQGLAKMSFLLQIPALIGRTSHYMLMTAHVGKEIQMASGPFAPQPTKVLQHLKHGDKVKGVSSQFFYLMSNCWQAYNSSVLLNQGTRGPEYPRNPTDNRTDDVDLNIVSIRQLRSKSGPSGCVIDIVVSQSEGVLPELTEFHYIKNKDRFGISGTQQHYALDLLPEEKLSRTTIRSKIAANPLLCRALNITAELCQIHQLWRHLDPAFLCTPKELYENLKQQGYDWNLLLKTRGWWTLENDKQNVPYLSTMDLLRMAAKTKPLTVEGLPYFPYWMNDDKTPKAPYADLLIRK